MGSGIALLVVKEEHECLKHVGFRYSVACWEHERCDKNAPSIGTAAAHSAKGEAWVEYEEMGPFPFAKTAAIC